MNADRLLEHFEQISDTADAVDRLRSLVFALAHQGRLLADTSITHWHSTTIGEVATEIRPGIPCAKSHQQADGCVHLRTHNVATSARMNFDLLIRVDPRRLDPNKRGLKKGDILFNNTNSQELVGKTCLVRDDYDFAFSNHLTRIRFCKEVAPAFVVSYFVHLLRAGFFSRICNRWIGQAGINTTALKAVPLTLPPLAEQHRIVAKVDELMALCDRLEAAQAEREARRDRLVSASLARVTNPDSDDAKSATTSARFHLDHFARLTTRPEHVKHLRQTILNLAVRGRLVPQSPGDESSLQALIRHGLGAAQEQQSADLPLGWACVHFEDVAVVSGGVTLGRKLGSRKTVRVPYLRVANVKRGHFDLAVVKEVEVAVDEVEKYLLRRDDVLMTEGGDWDKVGRSAIWQDQVPVCLHQNHVFRARMRSPEISPRWCEMYFNSPLGRSYFEGASKQTTNLASINMRQVRGCPIPLPPLAEQRRIVAKVDELMALCDHLETSLASAATDRARLLEALLHEALAPAA